MLMKLLSLLCILVSDHSGFGAQKSHGTLWNHPDLHISNRRRSQIQGITRQTGARNNTQHRQRILCSIRSYYTPSNSTIESVKLQLNRN